MRRFVRRLMVMATAAVSAAAFQLATVAGGGEDLIANGSFQLGIQGWVDNGGDLAWQADGASDPGAANLTNTLPFGYDNAAYAHQCVSVVGGMTYRLTATIRVPAEQPRALGGFMFFLYDPAAACGSSVGASTMTVNAPDWTPVSLDVAVPAGVSSVKIVMAAHKRAPGPGDDPAAPVRAEFDDIELRSVDNEPRILRRAIAPNIAR